MSSSLAAPRPLRRLTAVLLALSVMLTSLGWSHPSCESTVGHGDAAAAGLAHAGTAGGATAHHPAPGQDAGHHGGHCAGHGSRSAPDDGACAMVAHCSAAAVSGAAVVAVAELRRPARSTPVTAARPLERASQPESPPPRA